MSVTATPTPFPFEAALRDSLEIFQKNAAAFVVVLLIGTAPRFLGDLLLLMSGGLSFIATLLALVGFVTSVLAGATVQTAVLTGSSDLNAAMSSVTPRLLPLIGLSLIVGIAIGVGAILLLVPGIIAACALFAAVPLFLDQNTGVADSLQRSVELTKGNWLRIFFMLAIFGIVAGIAFVIIIKIFGLILGGLGVAVAGWLLAGVLGAYAEILVVVAYRKLRGGAFA
jgi:hypothetical protein